MRCVKLPRLNGKEIIIATDSSGHHHENPFEVFGIVTLDLDAFLRWEASPQGDFGELASDGFQETRRAHAGTCADPFLKSANTIEGLSF
jgi:hypothetical protein